MGYFLTLFFVSNSYACWLGNGKGLCRSGDERACLGSLGNGKGLFRKDKNRATEDGISSLTLQAFEKCDTDDLFGLSWDEIERCRKNFVHFCPFHAQLRTNLIHLMKMEMEILHW